MRIAFVSYEDPSDIRSWSGTPASMIAGLRAAGADVVPIGPLDRPGRALLGTAGRLSRRLTGRVYDYNREPYLLASYARQIRKALAKVAPVDVIVTPGAIATSALDIEVPTVIWTDATVGAMIDYYYPASTMTRRTLRNAVASERAALRRARLFVASSAWARDTAVAEYGIPAGATAVVPFGANLDDPGAPAARSVGDGPLRLLMVGVDWERKGVDLAIQATAALRDRGLDAHLDLVGFDTEAVVPPYVHHHGFVSKSTPEGLAELERLFRRATLFVLPSAAECTAIVACEAAAYGLPVVSALTGGMASVVRDGETGQLVASRDPLDYADAIESLVKDQLTYDTYSRNAYADFQQRLNWPVAGATLLSHISRVFG